MSLLVPSKNDMAQHISQRGTGARAHVLFFQYSLRRAHQFNVLEKILDELKAAKYLSVSVDSIVLQTDLQLISVDNQLSHNSHWIMSAQHSGIWQ